MSNKEIEEKEVWKQIEGFPKYDVSIFGRVRKDLGDNKYLYLKSDVNHAGYHRVSYSNKKERKRTALHRLVLAKFKPIDNMEKYQGNHKDGNKDNNRLSNLEWVTSSENSNHSYANNLNKDHTSLIIKDITTGEQHKMRSIEEASKFLDLATGTIVPYIKRSISYPLFYKYKIYVDTLKEETKATDKFIYVYDHIEDNYNVYRGTYLTAIHTGINPVTMGRKLKGRKLKNHNTWYNGGFTTSLKPLKDIERMDLHIATIDRKVMYATPLNKIDGNIEVYNPKDGTVVVYKSPKDLERNIHYKKIKNNNVQACMRRGAEINKPCLFNGLVIGKASKKYDLKNSYSKKDIYLSENGYKLSDPIYQVDDDIIVGNIKLAEFLNVSKNAIVNTGIKSISKRINKKIVKLDKDLKPIN